ncbi:hypothetical protein [Rhodococcoides yunnanense]|uniref:Uncharacterized protein n=1 Tax=Rhodococcoides yunnanense TaxID=278209 RepID=A0ABU4B7A3_9NOCA|nr:hypothetical protein [Rhodococcus yunnanensis]MDV6260073.1 hypothetical protein [Rhodococcus yunnanensis]
MPSAKPWGTVIRGLSKGGGDSDAHLTVHDRTLHAASRGFDSIVNTHVRHELPTCRDTGRARFTKVDNFVDQSFTRAVHPPRTESG